MMNNLAPIILFVYNRPHHTKLTLDSIKKNELSKQSELFIFSDGAKNEGDKEKVEEVRKLISGVSGFKNVTIFKSEKNKGLANSVIFGVTKIFEVYDKLIVFEDDILCSSNFLKFINKALDFYRNNPQIFSVSGYTFPLEFPLNYEDEIFVSYRASSWGWATWKDRWEKADWEVKDFDLFKNDKIRQREFNRGGEDLTTMLFKQKLGKIDSWAIRWGYSHYLNNAFCLYPKNSMIKNIGHDNSGTHSVKTKKFNVIINGNEYLPELKWDIDINKEIVNKISEFNKLSLFRKFINKIKYL